MMRFDNGLLQMGMGLVWLLGSPLSAIAAPMLADAATSEPASVEALDPATTAPMPEFEIYTLEDVFAIEVPQGWQVSEMPADRTAVLTNDSSDIATGSADTAIRTEVTLVAEPPNTYVEQELDALIQSGYAIDQYGLASVKGNTAFRVWLIDLPLDYTYQVITFIGYEQNTAKIVSYYNDPSPANIDLILYIHRPFELL
jgi:hypothetical protein